MPDPSGARAKRGTGRDVGTKCSHSCNPADSDGLVRQKPIGCVRAISTANIRTRLGFLGIGPSEVAAADRGA